MTFKEFINFGSFGNTNVDFGRGYSQNDPSRQVPDAIVSQPSFTTKPYNITKVVLNGKNYDISTKNGLLCTYPADKFRELLKTKAAIYPGDDICFILDKDNNIESFSKTVKQQ